MPVLSQRGKRCFGVSYPKESLVLDSTSLSMSKFKNTGMTGGVGEGNQEKHTKKQRDESGTPEKIYGFSVGAV